MKGGNADVYTIDGRPTIIKPKKIFSKKASSNNNKEREKNMKSASVKVVRRIKAPAESVWKTISAIGGVEQWLSIIKTCKFEGSGAGATRVCTMADGSTLNERIEKVDHQNRIFQYSIPEPPMPVKNLIGTMKVNETGKNGESEIEWSATFGVDESQEKEMSGLLEGIYREGINGLEKLNSH